MKKVISQLPFSGVFKHGIQSPSPANEDDCLILRTRKDDSIRREEGIQLLWGYEVPCKHCASIMIN